MPDPAARQVQPTGIRITQHGHQETSFWTTRHRSGTDRPIGVSMKQKRAGSIFESAFFVMGRRLPAHVLRMRLH